MSPGSRKETQARRRPKIAAVANTTLRDVANAAGVHTATASRALNPDTRNLVNAETARRVLRAAESLGYVPNPIARSLKTAHSKTIGVLLPDLTNPLFPPIVRGVQDVLREAGYSGLIVNTDGDPDIERAQISSLRSWHVEGLIVATAMLDHPLLEELHGQMKLVLVNRHTGSRDIPSVVPDDAAGVEAAVRHLAELGHRRILHLAGPSSTSTGAARSRAFTHTVQDLGLDASPELLVECPSWTEEQGAAAMRDVLDRKVDFTAVMAGNDLIALGCYDVFFERGISCPEDVSVVGFNDMPFLDKLRPPLTTVHVPHQEIGEEACRMLLDVLRKPDRPARSVLLPVSLVVRGSTAPPRA